MILFTAMAISHASRTTYNRHSLWLLPFLEVQIPRATLSSSRRFAFTDCVSCDKSYF